VPKNLGILAPVMVYKPVENRITNKRLLDDFNYSVSGSSQDMRSGNRVKDANKVETSYTLENKFSILVAPVLTIFKALPLIQGQLIV
jgi:hypothetical protein